MKRTCIFLIFIFSFTSIFAQQNNEEEEFMPAMKKQYYVFSPRFSITVPHPTSNKAFRKSFVGVYGLSAGLNIMLFKGAFIGVTYKNSLIKVFENRIPDLEANMQMNDAGIKVGIDNYVGSKNRMIFSASVNVGYNWTTYSRFKCKTIYGKTPISGFSTNYIEPEINYYFLVEENLGIGANIHYTLLNQNFNPYDLCLNEWSQFDKSNPGNIQYLSFGFGIYYGFMKKQEKRELK